MHASFFAVSFSLLSLALSTPVAVPEASRVTLSGRASKAAVTNKAGLTWYDPNLSDGTSGRSDPSGGYVCFKGPASNFPAMNTWINFNSMWKVMVQYALTPIGDSSSEQQAIYNGIISVSKAAKVDPRVILAVIILESTGNVRVKCTNNGVNNCGLMQSYNGSSYNPNNMQASITQMISDGTQGTAYGPGLVQDFNNNATTAGNVYAVMRLYNSGSVNSSNLSDGRGATPSYVSNIANYLQGWNGYGNGPANCNFS